MKLEQLAVHAFVDLEEISILQYFSAVGVKDDLIEPNLLPSALGATLQIKRQFIIRWV